ncbi:MAG: hypothetical protein C5B55_00085 [Blastocatellia bacterium]|nr:MAG: hypothetical protein C5B55_00085 [Blastocatellia bacterium]
MSTYGDTPYPIVHILALPFKNPLLDEFSVSVSNKTVFKFCFKPFGTGDFHMRVNHQILPEESAMTTKLSLTLFAAICLATGTAVAQEPSATTNLEELSQNAFSLLDSGGYLGVYAEDITRENMSRYNLGQPRGVGVTQVTKDSPAEKAGIRKDDVILRVDGENVTSVRKLNRLVSEIAPDQSVRIAISRAGSEQELSATIAKRQNSFARLGDFGTETPRIWKWEGPSVNGEGNWAFALTNTRRIGVTTTELTKQLADYFGVPGGKGVLITSVTEDGPAAKAGLKAGDVVTAIDGEVVGSTGDISRIINNKKEGDVTLSVVRNKTQLLIRVTPKEGGTFSSGTIIRPQIGRRIVIPRVEFPDFPEIDIAMPRIEIPSIPAINIEMPNIKVTPKVKALKVKAQPI